MTWITSFEVSTSVAITWASLMNTCLLLDANGDRSAFDRLRRLELDHLLSGHLPGHHVIQQHLAESLRVREETVECVLVQCLERLVRRSKTVNGPSPLSVSTNPAASTAWSSGEATGGLSGLDDVTHLGAIAHRRGQDHLVDDMDHAI